MKSFNVSALTLSDLTGTVALGSIKRAAELRGVSPEEILLEVAAEPLSIHELCIGLQLRADDIIEDVYAEKRAAGGDAELSAFLEEVRRIEERVTTEGRA